jgi:hypothetical protein
VEALKMFLAEQAKDPNPPVSMQGDPVHPGPPGQLMMAAGVNLTAYGQGPIADQGKAILAQVGNKENLVSQWRWLSRTAALGNGSANLAEQMDKLRKSIDEADAHMRREAQPRQRHFRVVPAGQAQN